MNFTVKAAMGNFFDRSAVIKRTDAAIRKNLSKYGAFVRTRARSSLRYRDKTSTPGAPPSLHKTMFRMKTSKKGVTKKQSVSPLREFLFFAYDDSRKSVVIGPSKLSGKIGSAPQALEYGGVSIVRAPGGGTRTVQIRARPFMRPAAEATNRELPSIWQNSIKR